MQRSGARCYSTLAIVWLSLFALTSCAVFTPSSVDSRSEAADGGTADCGTKLNKVNTSKAFVEGRVLAGPESEPVSDVSVLLTSETFELELCTDADGYFAVNAPALEPFVASIDPGTLPAGLVLYDPDNWTQTPQEIGNSGRLVVNFFVYAEDQMPEGDGGAAAPSAESLPPAPESNPLCAALDESGVVPVLLGDSFFLLTSGVGATYGAITCTYVYNSPEGFAASSLLMGQAWSDTSDQWQLNASDLRSYGAEIERVANLSGDQLSTGVNGNLGWWKRVAASGESTFSVVTLTGDGMAEFVYSAPAAEAAPDFEVMNAANAFFARVRVPEAVSWAVSEGYGEVAR